MTIRVLVADDQELVRTGFSMIIDAFSGLSGIRPPSTRGARGIADNSGNAGRRRSGRAKLDVAEGPQQEARR